MNLTGPTRKIAAVCFEQLLAPCIFFFTLKPILFII